MENDSQNESQQRSKTGNDACRAKNLGGVQTKHWIRCVIIFGAFASLLCGMGQLADSHKLFILALILEVTSVVSGAITLWIGLRNYNAARKHVALFVSSFIAVGLAVCGVLFWESWPAPKQDITNQMPGTGEKKYPGQQLIRVMPQNIVGEMRGELVAAPHPTIITYQMEAPPITNQVGVAITITSQLPEPYELAKQIQEVFESGGFVVHVARQDISAPEKNGVTIICPNDFINLHTSNAIDLLFVGINQKPRIDFVTNWHVDNWFHSSNVLHKPMEINVGEARP